MADLGVLTVAALMVLGLVGGIGITSLGPGGVLPTIGLFTLTGLTAPVVAGTAIVTHVATGLAGSAAFVKSGQLCLADTRRTAILLAATAALGTPLGVVVNAHVSERAFGIVLAILVTAAALLVWVRGRHGDAAGPGRHPRAVVIVGLGLAVAVLSGIIGIGGPMLAVPALIACGVPVLESLAASQVQSIVIAIVGSVGYATQGNIDWTLAVLIGVPELVGVFVGWRIAHALPTRVLKIMLVVALLALAPYLALA